MSAAGCWKHRALRESSILMERCKIARGDNRLAGALGGGAALTRGSCSAIYIYYFSNAGVSMAVQEQHHVQRWLLCLGKSVNQIYRIVAPLLAITLIIKQTTLNN